MSMWEMPRAGVGEGLCWTEQPGTASWRRGCSNPETEKCVLQRSKFPAEEQSECR